MPFLESVEMVCDICHGTKTGLDGQVGPAGREFKSRSPRSDTCFSVTYNWHYQPMGGVALRPGR